MTCYSGLGARTRVTQTGDDRWGPRFAWLWCAVGGLICAAAGKLEPNLLEEGLLVHVAERMLEGEHLYSDIVLVTGPVPYAMVAGIFEVFGSTISAARIGVAVLHGLACGSVYTLARRSNAGPWAHASAATLASAPVLLFPLLVTAFYTTIATSLAFIAAWMALRGVRSSAWAFAAGVVIALTALSKQTVGTILAITLVATVAACAPRGQRLRRSAALCAGGAAVTLVSLATFMALGDLEAFVSSLLIRPESRAFDSPMINLWPPGSLSPEIVKQKLEFYYVPEVVFTLREGKFGSPALVLFLTQVVFGLPVLVLALTAVRRVFGPLPAALWSFAAVTLACASNLFPRPDSGHVVFAAPAAVAYAFCLAGNWLPARGSATRRIGVACAAALVLLLGGSTLWVGERLLSLAGPPSFGPRVPMPPVNPVQKSGTVPRAIQYVRERIQPGEPIYVARAEPLVYFATGGRNPTPFTGALQVWGVRDEQQDEILDALEEVRFVVMSDLDDPLHTTFREEMPRVQEALERSFHVPEHFTGRRRSEDWMIVLERGRDRGPTLIDLADPGLEPRAWIRKSDGTRVGAPQSWREKPTRQNRRPLAMALGDRGGGVDWRLEVPANARLQVSSGFKKVHGSKQPNRVRFEVKISDGGPFRTLASRRTVFDSRRGSGRSWTDLDVDLSEYAGRTITLRLEAVAAKRPKRGRVAFWGSPRVAGPAAEN